MGQIAFESLGKVMQGAIKEDQHLVRTKIGTAKFASELCESSEHLGNMVGDSVHGQIYHIIQEMKKDVKIKDIFTGMGVGNPIDLSSLRIEPQDLFDDYHKKLDAMKRTVYKSFKKGEPWLKEGKKASTVLKELLQETFTDIDKKNIIKIAEVMSSKAKECYSPDGNYVGYFGQGKLVGEGIWETEGTCTRIKDKATPHLFSSGWTEAQNRVFPLVARSIKTPKAQKGRVIVAFGGNGCVRFWNNYYVGQKISLENFVKIFEAMYETEMEKVPASKLPANINNSNFIRYAKELIYQNPSQGWWKIKDRPKRKTYFAPTKIRCASCKAYVNKVGITGKDRHKFICETCSGSECPMCRKPSTTKLMSLTTEQQKKLHHPAICSTCHEEHIGTCKYCREETSVKFWFLHKKEAEQIFCCDSCSKNIVEAKDKDQNTLAYECSDCGIFVELKDKKLYNEANNLCLNCVKVDK